MKFDDLKWTGYAGVGKALPYQEADISDRFADLTIGDPNITALKVTIRCYPVNVHIAYAIDYTERKTFKGKPVKHTHTKFVRWRMMQRRELEEYFDRTLSELHRAIWEAINS